MDRELVDALCVIVERRNWLRERIKAKKAIGWETQWDRAPRAARAGVTITGGLEQ